MNDNEYTLDDKRASNNSFYMVGVGNGWNSISDDRKNEIKSLYKGQTITDFRRELEREHGYIHNGVFLMVLLEKAGLYQRKHLRL